MRLFKHVYWRQEATSGPHVHTPSDPWPALLENIPMRASRLHKLCTNMGQDVHYMPTSHRYPLPWLDHPQGSASTTNITSHVQCIAELSSEAWPCSMHVPVHLHCCQSQGFTDNAKWVPLFLANKPHAHHNTAMTCHMQAFTTAQHEQTTSACYCCVQHMASTAIASLLPAWLHEGMTAE